MVIGDMATNYAIILGVSIAGVLLYFVAKYCRLNHDEIDMKMAFMEIPPEQESFLAYIIILIEIIF